MYRVCFSNVKQTKTTILCLFCFSILIAKVNVRGQMRTSEEEAECTNHEQFAAVIKENAAMNDFVIAEGSHLVYMPQVTALLNQIFLLDLGADSGTVRF